MTKADLAQKISTVLGTSKADGERAMNVVVDEITAALKRGEDVSITGFGTFTVSHRKARTGVNPQNPSIKIQIPAMKVPKFKSGKGLKEAVR
jgi:DNA-binding protein HU-beta